jgi:1,4-dihydroxy-6-naphthoate synthase
LVRRESPGLPSKDEIESAVRTSLDWAWSHEDAAMELCARHAQDMSPEVMRAHVALYVNAFSREMGEEGRAAVRTLERVQQYGNKATEQRNNGATR